MMWGVSCSGSMRPPPSRCFDRQLVGSVEHLFAVALGGVRLHGERTRAVCSGL